MVWAYKKLSELAEVSSGGTPKRSSKEFWNGNIPWYSSGELNDFYTNASKEYITQNGLSNSNAKLFPKGSLLIGMYDTAALKMSLLDREGAFNQAIAGVRPNKNIDLSFILYAINSIKPKLLNLRRGVRQKNLNQGMIKDILIPDIPIQEQKRIVSILDTALADLEQARVKTEQNLKNARELFDSYLQQVFSQKGEGWKTLPLETFTHIVNGYAFKSGDFSSNNEVKSIKITNVGVYEFVEEVDNYLPEGHLKKYSQYRAYEGNIVVALTRTIISTGLKVAVVPSSYNGALINQRVAAVQVDENIMSNTILQAFLSTKMAIDYVKSNVNELMQPNLSIKDLKAFPIPVPPADKLNSVKKELSEVIEQKNRLVEIYTKKLNAIDELKKSILQKAFSGELTNTAE